MCAMPVESQSKDICEKGIWFFLLSSTALVNLIFSLFLRAKLYKYLSPPPYQYL